MKTLKVFTRASILICILVVSCQAVPGQSIEDQIRLNRTTPIIDDPTTPPLLIESQSINEVTVTIDWVLADAKRVSFGYTIEGLPPAPEALDLFGTVQLVEQSGTGELGWGGNSKIARVQESPGKLVGSWSSVFAKPFTLPSGNFDLLFTLGYDGEIYNHNFIVASFPLPASATPFPPNVFPPRLPDHEIGSFHFEFETPIYPLMELSPAQTVFANGVEMRLEKMDITASFTSATLCYSKPSSRDWMTGRSGLKTGEGEESNNTYSLLADTEYGESLNDFSPQLDAGRCVQLEFLAGHSNQPGEITLMIPALEQSVPEVIPDDEIAKAREKLLQQGIDISWKVESIGGGGISGPVYNKLPVGMTEMEAYQQLLEALGYFHEGPWVFTVEVNP